MSIEDIPKRISEYDAHRNVVKIAGKEIKVGGPIPTPRPNERVLRYTQSLCPYCRRILPAIIVERQNKVFIRRICPEHGEIEEVYWSDAELFRKFMKFDIEGRGPGYVYTELTAPCPYSCGLCPLHKSHTALLNIVVTNRCDLSCWYCFFYAEKAGYVYEPTIDQIRSMVRALKLQKGIVPAVQLTGGEPTLREDLEEIVKVLRDEGVRHIQLNTHGTRFARLFLEDPNKAIEYARRLRNAGVNTVYLSFDGVSPKTNPKNHWEIPFIFETFRKARMTSVVLVPTLIKTVNDHEIGDILKFAAYNLDIVRGVNIQPVSLTGMMKKQDRERYRITIPDAIKLIEDQTEGQITRSDWYPVDAAVPIAKFIESFDRSKRVEFTTHPACGAATYVYVKKKRNGDIEFIPITRFVDVDGLLEYLYRKAIELEGKPQIIAKLLAIPSILNILNKYIYWDRVPEGLKNEFKSILLNIFLKRNYEALGKLHYKMLFIGMMHFMDLYNYDIQRVMRCVIHYGLPDGRIVPFCAFNILDDIYRETVQQGMGLSLDEYARRYGSEKIYGLKYTRTKELIEKMVKSDIYRRTYEPFKDKIEYLH